MLNSGFAQDINVYIGDENEKDELKDFSIVTFKHKVGDKDLGTIGIIGPKRMDSEAPSRRMPGIWAVLLPSVSAFSMAW